MTRSKERKALFVIHKNSYHPIGKKRMNSVKKKRLIKNVVFTKILVEFLESIASELTMKYKLLAPIWHVHVLPNE